MTHTGRIFCCVISVVIDSTENSSTPHRRGHNFLTVWIVIIFCRSDTNIVLCIIGDTSKGAALVNCGLLKSVNTQLFLNIICITVKSIVEGSAYNALYPSGLGLSLFQKASLLDRVVKFTYLSWDS